MCIFFVLLIKNSDIFDWIGNLNLKSCQVG